MTQLRMRHPLERKWALVRALFITMVALYLLFLFAITAFAADAPIKPVTTVDAAPLIAVIQPYLTAIATALVTAIFSVILAQVNSLLKRMGLSQGLQIDAQHRDALRVACASAAARIFAKLDGGAATMKFDVGSPFVAAEAQAIITKVPDAISYFGLSPDGVAQKVVAEFGKLQATAQSATPVVPAK